MYPKRFILWCLGLFSILLLSMATLLTYKASRAASIFPYPSPHPQKDALLASPTDGLVPINHLPLSLEKVFDDELESASHQSWKLAVGGDYNPGRHVNVVATHQNSFGSLLEQIQGVFADADIALLNLEGALLRDCPLQSQGMTFCGSAKHALGLQNAGIDVVSLANNHSLNYGVVGLQETKNILDAHAVNYAGFDEINTIHLGNGHAPVAIIGIDATLQQRSPQEIAKLINTAANQSTIVIPYFHWGSEYTHDPNAHQIYLARTAIDAGATLVLGSHPHWVQAVEIYKQKLIVYSHGNLVFDQFWSEKTRQGIVGEYAFSGNSVIDARFLPVYIDEGYKPRWLLADKSAKVLEAMQSASKKLEQSHE
jgi:poly-gamma-glutamate synthesis protein (capsule biosynthesis protein)